MDIVSEINQLKQEKDIIILAHYYVDGDIQDIADFVGDSYALSKKASEVSQSAILFAGVGFMGESAKILSPNKKVLMPDLKADCPMAHMVTPEEIERFKEGHPDGAVVCYVNSTAETKAAADVCVTSSNADKVVGAMSEKEIYFVPDGNLGRYIAQKHPEKQFYFHNGYCHVHNDITPEMVRAMKKAHPGAKVLMHPECSPVTLVEADYIGSTAGIIAYPDADGADKYIIATEKGVLHELGKRYEAKTFIPISEDCICVDMKMNTLEKVYQAMVDFDHTVEMASELITAAEGSLVRMLELAE